VKEEKAILDRAGVDLAAYHCKTEQEIVEAAADADILVVQFSKVTRRMLEQLPRCQAVIRYAVGVDNIDLEAATEMGILVVNVPDYCVDEVSNHAITLMLSLARKIPQISQSIKDGKWDYTVAKPIGRLAGKTLGIVGFGRIGRAVAHKMMNFGMQVIAYDPFVDEQNFLMYQAKRVDFQTLLQTSDYISVHTPLTDKTEYMFDRKAFDGMKPGMTLVNTARGRIVKEEDLLYALDKGILSAVALDVTEREPLSMEDPLLRNENVIVTPHFAWYSEDSLKRLQQIVAEEAVRILSGQFPKHLVNRQVLQISGRGRK
jgi:D-3-phosphoglycerate dehydrogenase